MSKFASGTPSRRMPQAVFLVVIGLLVACAETRTLTLPAAPPDLFDHAMPIEVGTAYVIGDRHGRVAAGAGEGAGMGALSGAGGSVAAGFVSGGPGLLLAGIVLAPVAAVAGAIAGAAEAHPEEETRAAITAIEEVYNDAALMTGLGGMLANRISAQGFPANLACPDPMLRQASARPARNSPPLPRGCEPGPPKNLLRMDVKYDFRTEGGLSPDLFLDVDVAGLAANSDRQRQAMEFHWIYRTRKMDFLGATTANAAALRQAIRQVQQSLADRIVDDLFVARNAERVTGTYIPMKLSHNFELRELDPGVAHRMPAASQYPPWSRNPRYIEVPPALLEK
jgi:hypothetical protein